MTRTQSLVLAAVMSAAGLAACSGPDREPEPVANEAQAEVPSPAAEAPPAPIATETASPAPAAEALVTNDSVVDVPREDVPAPDEQMMDDAAATGMTARATRDDPTTSQTAPAEQIEKK